MLTIAEKPASGGSPGVTATKPKRKLLTRKKCFLGLVVVVAACFLFRTALLVAAATVLVVDENGANAGTLVFSGDSHLLPEAARFQKDHPQSGMLIIHGRNRLEEIGVVPNGEATVRRRLLARNVPGDSIEFQSYPAWQNDWDAARCLCEWMNRNPASSVCVLSNRFESRIKRRILDSVLGAEQAQRVFVRPVSDVRFDESNWWKCKEGATSFFGSMIWLGHVYWFGDDTAQRREWDPDVYERGLLPCP